MLILEPENIGLDNFKCKLALILTEQLTNLSYSVMAAISVFLTIFSSC